MEIPFSNRGTTKLLTRLKDTNIENPTNDQVLEYDATEKKWINSSAGIYQEPLDTPVVASPSGTGNLTLTNGTGINNLLTYTPTDKNTISGNTIVSGDITATADLITASGSVTASTKLKSTGLATIGSISIPSGTSTVQAVSTTTTTSSGLTGCDSLTVVAGLTTTTLNCTGTIITSSLVVGGQAFGATINWVSQPIWLRSDSRLKWNQQPITDGVEKIMKMKPMTYDAANEIVDVKPDNCKKSAGFIAQDIEQISELKDFVRRNEFDDVLRLDYGALFTHSVKAIQEINNELILEDKKIAILYEKINNIMIKLK